MSRKFDRQLKINTEVVRILEDPATMHYLAGKLIRKRPRKLLFTINEGKENQRGIYLSVPQMIWKVLLLIVLAPGTRKKPQVETVPK